MVVRRLVVCCRFQLVEGDGHNATAVFVELMKIANFGASGGDT